MCGIANVFSYDTIIIGKSSLVECSSMLDEDEGEDVSWQFGNARVRVKEPLKSEDLLTARR